MRPYQLIDNVARADGVRPGFFYSTTTNGRSNIRASLRILPS